MTTDRTRILVQRLVTEEHRLADLDIGRMAHAIEKHERQKVITTAMREFAEGIIDQWRVVAGGYGESDIHAALGATSVDAIMLGERDARTSHSLHTTSAGERCYVMATKDMVTVYRAPDGLETAEACARLLACIEVWDVSAMRVASAIDEDWQNIARGRTAVSRMQPGPKQ